MSERFIDPGLKRAEMAKDPFVDSKGPQFASRQDLAAADREAQAARPVRTADSETALDTALEAHNPFLGMEGTKAENDAELFKQTGEQMWTSTKKQSYGDTPISSAPAPEFRKESYKKSGPETQTKNAA